MARIFHYRHQPGYTRLAGPGEAGLELLECGVLRVLKDETYHSAVQDREAVLVMLNGACRVQVDGEQWHLERVSVFAEPAVAVYVPRHRHYDVAALKPSELALFLAPAGRDQLPRLIGPGLAERQGRGSLPGELRTCEIVGADLPATRLLVGETYIASGGWASYPPHKHDQDLYPDEVRLEEVAIFQVDPPQGFALQYVYTPDRVLDEVHVLHNDEAVALSRGYHPVASVPGYTVYYLWGMAGEGHLLRSSLDPAHAWVAEESGERELTNLHR